MTLRVLQFGSTGQVARAILDAAGARDARVIALSRQDADLSDATAVGAAVRAHGSSADVVVNAAAYTAVDAAESDEAAAHAVNAEAPRMMAQACAELSLPLIHLSTDYVFNGEKSGAYAESDPPDPLNAYGRSKLAGEVAVREALGRSVILRTSGVYSATGRNFLTTMLNMPEERETLGVVDDQILSPTAARDIAETVLTIAAKVAPNDGPWGTYHFCAAGRTSWAGFAEAIYDAAAPWRSRRPEIKRISSKEYGAAAARPANSVLDCAKIEAAFGVRPRPWREALAETVEQFYRQRAGADA
ncbi:MAG: dTDP-4-dehydrorhamnose reductase [Maricaulaceae bacterium]